MYDKELLDFNIEYENADFYPEVMKLINGDIDEKQFLKNNYYYEMVEEIYLNAFAKLDEFIEEYRKKNYDSSYVLDYCIESSIITYNNLKALNIYFNKNFKPYDKDLVYYVAGQYIYYFKKHRFKNWN